MATTLQAGHVASHLDSLRQACHCGVHSITRHLLRICRARSEQSGARKRRQCCLARGCVGMGVGSRGGVGRMVAIKGRRRSGGITNIQLCLLSGHEESSSARCGEVVWGSVQTQQRHWSPASVPTVEDAASIELDDLIVISFTPNERPHGRRESDAAPAAPTKTTEFVRRRTAPHQGLSAAHREPWQ